MDLSQRTGSHDRRRCWGTSATNIQRRWCGAGDLLIVKCGKDSSHVRRAISDVAVIVVGSQEVHISRL